ncbi:hypothetical protein KP77_26000 [Jeotgalibacillus alimentarius]|uniref:Spore coat protein n=1 Tax=Jeotgalibacillus alimentarius TaxID=135826 RepID=A0A0C2VR75_9BACL|nr:hypothetical protein [Jeotgalibacillus alimentarius]KIL46473.1 hypothetical protein KP77_26000 [Jeotgalibacillus alimentarius]
MMQQQLSTKDLLYLKDVLEWNLIASKKAHFAASQCTNPQLKSILETCCTTHKNHYEKTSAFLSGQQQVQ